MCVCVCVCVCVYIYIYREREREINFCTVCPNSSTFSDIKTTIPFESKRF